MCLGWREDHILLNGAAIFTMESPVTEYASITDQQVTQVVIFIQPPHASDWSVCVASLSHGCSESESDLSMKVQNKVINGLEDNEKKRKN